MIGALLTLGRWEEYISAVVDITQTYAQYPFAYTIVQHLERTGLPMIKRWLGAEVQTLDAGLAASDQVEYAHVQRTLVAVVKMMFQVARNQQLSPVADTASTVLCGILGDVRTAVDGGWRNLSASYYKLLDRTRARTHLAAAVETSLSATTTGRYQNAQIDAVVAATVEALDKVVLIYQQPSTPTSTRMQASPLADHHEHDPGISARRRMSINMPRRQASLSFGAATAPANLVVVPGYAAVVSEVLAFTAKLNQLVSAQRI